jgi:hypothetical protein
MVALPEDDTFPEKIRRIETTDPVLGGPPNEANGDGLSNIAPMQLAKRTRWLKTRIDALIAAVIPGTTAVAGIVQLSTATNSTATDMAATPSAVKAANDNANTRALATRTITAGGLATGGGDMSANRTITVPIATQAQAEAGTDNATAMTPLRAAQAIAAAIAAGTAQAGSAILSAISALAANGLIVRTGAGTVANRSIQGGNGITVTNGNGVAGNPNVEITGASQAEAEAGTSDARVMTPLRVAQAIAAALSGILAAIAGLGSNGIITRTAAGTAAARTIIGGNGVTVTDGNGVAGNPTVEITGASQAEAEAGTSNARVMTPLRVAQAIAAVLAGAVSFASTLTALRLRITATGDASLSSTTHGFQIGADDGSNLIMDNNEIMARNNGAAATLMLNADGGNLTMGDATSLVNLPGELSWGYESPAQTITGGSVLTLAHGLGQAPKHVEVAARCVTAQSPYAVGDEVPMDGYVTAGVSYGVTVGVSATQIKIRTADASRLYLQDNAGSYIVMTTSNWRFVARARK